VQANYDRKAVAYITSAVMRLMGTAEIARALGVGRQRAYVISRRKDFPDPVATLEMGAVWDAEVVEAWIRTHRPVVDEGPET
jgi:prophage regulatory protein